MRRRTKKRLYGLALVAGLVVVSINGAVRFFGGGAPSLFSPLSLEDKVRALVALAKHVPSHVLEDTCEGDRLFAVHAAAKRHRVPADLAVAVARTESTLNSHAISHAGAMGLMQLMPDTADHMKVEDPFDPAENADGAVRYLAWLLERYRGDRRRALAAYNAGPYAIPQFGPVALPRETRRYVRKVLGQLAPITRR